MDNEIDAGYTGNGVRITNIRFDTIIFTDNFKILQENGMRMIYKCGQERNESKHALTLEPL